MVGVGLLNDKGGTEGWVTSPAISFSFTSMGKLSALSRSIPVLRMEPVSKNVKRVPFMKD